MFKCLNNLAPSYLSDFLAYLSHHQSYTKRNVIKNHLAILHPIDLSLINVNSLSEFSNS